MSFWDALAHPEAGGRERTPKPPELRAGAGDLVLWDSRASEACVLGFVGLSFIGLRL